MKLFCLTLRSKWGEPFNVTLPGNSIEEVLLHIVLDTEWQIENYSVLEATA